MVTHEDEVSARAYTSLGYGSTRLSSGVAVTGFDPVFGSTKKCILLAVQ